MRAVLVTGGAGFIGSHLCDMLVRDCKVICIDNLVTGTEQNIEHLREKKDFQFIKHDITESLDAGNVDTVFHLASPASPVDFQRIPIEILLVNALGTKNMIELALKNEARLIHASTSEVYGDPKEHPQKESYWGNVNPNGPRSCYDEGKRFSEALVMAYRRKFGLNAGIVRIFNTYGPRMRLDDGRVIPNFISQALTGTDITVYGDGSQTRSFCFVSDMVEGMLKMAQTDEVGPINVGNPDEYKVLEIANTIIELTGSSSKLVFKELPKDDPRRRKPDISLAEERLGWQPKVDLQTGLRETIEWFKEQL